VKKGEQTIWCQYVTSTHAVYSFNKKIKTFIVNASYAGTYIFHYV